MKTFTVTVAAFVALALLMVPGLMKGTVASAAPVSTGKRITGSGDSGASLGDVGDASGPQANSGVSAKPPPKASWTLRNPAAKPSARNSHGMVYDSARGRTVLFGGLPGSGPPHYNDTWEWNGSTWSNRNPVVKPAGRSTHAMAYDVARSRTVLFGGVSSQAGVYSTFADTWEWDGTTWSERIPVTTSPPGLHSPAMTYASLDGRQRVVLFGGATTDGTDFTPQADTWEWDGTDWSLMNPTVSPPARSHAAMTYDAARGRVVLFGGRAGGWNAAGGGTPLGDTWEWDGSTWTQRFPTASPMARNRAAMTYDSGRGRIVLFGGGDNGNGYLGDTWEWDGSNWSQVIPTGSPPARGYTSLAYDAARGRSVLFGGAAPPQLFADTWVYAGVAPQ